MSDQALEQAIAATDSREKRKRILPTYVVVALVIAMNLWSADSIIDVFNGTLTVFTYQKGVKASPDGDLTSSSLNRLKPRYIKNLAILRLNN
ncbi:MAG: transposase domain-containing protein [Xenococcaceae cyanobacterium]